MNHSLIEANRYRFFAIGAVGTFMSTLDGSILNVALPSIASDLGADIDVVAWVVLAYTLTLISLMIIFGAWTERRGYAFAYKFGYVFFTVGSLGCALSGSIYPLIISRVVQAIGSAMFQAVGPGMVTAVFPTRERGKGIGLMVMMVAAGLMAGPPLGGLLLKFFPWQSVFVINLPIGVAGFFLAARYFGLLPKPEFKKPMYLGGGLSIAVALVTFTFGLSMLSDYPLSDVRVWGMGVLSALGLLLFIRFESRPGKALLGLSLFKNRQFMSALIAAILMFVTMAGALILMPFYLERVRGFGPSTVGMYLVILPAIMFILAPLSGRISDKIGFRFLTTFGMLVMIAGQYLLAQLQVDSPNSYVIICLVVIGSGVAIFNTPNSSSMMGAVTPEQRARASSVIGTSRNIGMSMGVALATALFAYFKSHYSVEIGDAAEIFVTSYQKVAFVSMLVAVAALPFCVLRENRSKDSGPSIPPAAE